MIKTCPKCRLVNPDTAERCECGYDLAQVAAETVDAASENIVGFLTRENRVGFLTRVRARLLDGVFSYLAGFVGLLLAGAPIASGLGPSKGHSCTSGGGLALALIAGIGALGGYYLYWILALLLEGLVGASPGKMSLGIRIRNADGSRPEVAKLLRRLAIRESGALALVHPIFGLFELLAFLGCFMVLGHRRQALHDRLAGTAVFRNDYIPLRQAIEEPKAPEIADAPKLDLES